MNVVLFEEMLVAEELNDKTELEEALTVELDETLLEELANAIFEELEDTTELETARLEEDTLLDESESITLKVPVALTFEVPPTVVMV